MNKKYFIFAFIFVCLTLALSWGAWQHARQNKELSYSGTATFGKTKNKLSYLGHVRISSQAYGEINLYRQDGLWHFKEAKDYFANHEQLNNLFEMFNSSIIISADIADKKSLRKHGLDDATGVMLQNYDLDGTLLEQMIIGNQTRQNTCYARVPERPDVYYQISNCIRFAGKPEDWIPYPLLSIPHHLIQRLKSPRIELYHDEIYGVMLNSTELRRIILALGSINYQGIIYKEELPSAEELPLETNRVEVEMADGLMYVLNVHKIDDEYWLEVQLKTGKVARQKVVQMIEKNQQYFDKWLFQLSDYDGSLLFEF